MAPKDFTAMQDCNLPTVLGMDARLWAIAFNQHAVKLGYSEMDEGWLIGWFANAIMQTHDTLLESAPVVLPDGSAFFTATV